MKIEEKPQQKQKGHEYTLNEIESAVYNQLVDVGSNYKFFTDFVKPLLKQQPLCDAFPAILIRLRETTKSAIIFGISKLVDTSRDPYIIHFKKFILRAKQIPEKEIKDNPTWQRFLQEADLLLSDLPELKKKIDPLRNTYYAHLKPAMPNAKESTTWEFWRKQLERMGEIYNLYTGAVREAATSPFWVINMEHEPKSFLQWARLDDFKKHRDGELQRRFNDRTLKINTIG